MRRILRDAGIPAALDDIDRGTAYANIIQLLDVCKSEGIQEPYLDTVVTE